MNWNSIKFYLALVDNPTLADAAEILNVSDATVMRHIQSLENSLKTTLFIRSRSGHALTPAGKTFFPTAKIMESNAHKIQYELAGDNSILSGNVTIATTEFGADYIVGPALEQFRSLYPSMTLTLNVSPDHLDISRSDAGLALRFKRPESGPYVINKIGSIPWGIYVAKSALDNFGISQDLTIKGNEPIIGWGPPVSDIRIARALRRSFPNATPTINIPTLHGQLDAVKNAMGIAHIPCALGDNCDYLIRLKSPEKEISLDAWLVQPIQYKNFARIKAVAKFVRNAVNDFLKH